MEFIRRRAVIISMIQQQIRGIWNVPVADLIQLCCHADKTIADHLETLLGGSTVSAIFNKCLGQNSSTKENGRIKSNERTFIKC